MKTENFAEELADIILRVADLAETHKIDLMNECIKKMEKNFQRGTRGRKK